MSEKFNSGRGAVICDGCRTMLLADRLPGGGFARVIKPVLIAARNPDEPDMWLSQVDFCSAACAHAYCQSEDCEPAERPAICLALAGYYEGIKEAARD